MTEYEKIMKKRKRDFKLAQWWQDLHRRQVHYSDNMTDEQLEPHMPERITMLTAIRILLAELGEKEYWRTLWHLIWRPGYAIADYLNGKRRKYLHPFQLLVGTTLLLGLALFIVPAKQKPIDSVEVRLTNDLLNQSVGEEYAPEAMEFVQDIAHSVDAYNMWLNEHMALGLLLKSTFVIIFTWLLFRKSPRKGCPFIADKTDGKKATYNFAEILTAQIFIIVQMQIVNVVWVLVSGWFVPYINFHPYAFPFILANIIVFIDYQQLFGRKWYDTLWRTILALVFMW